MLKLLLTALMIAATSLTTGELPRQIGAGHLQTRNGDSYALRITSYYQEKGVTTVVLSNGTVWRLLSPVLWLVGDVIFLKGRPDGGWELYNSSDKSSTRVQFVKLKGEGLHRLKSNGNSGGTLTLDDGSVWHVSWWQRLWGMSWQWRAGDRIIISPLQLPLKDHTNLLIDIDRDWHHLESGPL